MFNIKDLNTKRGLAICSLYLLLIPITSATNNTHTVVSTTHSSSSTIFSSSTSISSSSNDTTISYSNKAGSTTNNSMTAIQDSDFFYNGQPNPLAVELGKFLFFDKILSGNKNISCATCHHPTRATGDELSLPIGEGGSGSGVNRNTGTGYAAVKQRVPRNSPPLFNLGLKQVHTLFYDGRLSVNPQHPSGFNNPADSQLPLGLDNILAAQAMFPVTSSTEMAGQAGENPIADAAAINNFDGDNGVWPLLTQRLQSIPEYVELFRTAFGIPKEEISFVYVANAIAAYETIAFRVDNSPFDQYLRGDLSSMTDQAQYGMQLFYSSAGCSRCHSGTLQTDQAFYSIAFPQIGPGKNDGKWGLEDFGRERVSNKASDRYKFRTPSLRNIVLTSPYGHSGAYQRLESIIYHHLKTESSLKWYSCESQAVLPYNQSLSTTDCAIMNDADSVLALMDSNQLEELNLNNQEFAAIYAFLEALTDNSSQHINDLIPSYVPSGISIID